MARRIDWDSVSRQNRLKKWIRENSPFLNEFDLTPNQAQDAMNIEIERWAKETVRRISARVRSGANRQLQRAVSPIGQLELTLRKLGEEIENGNADEARVLATQTLNLAMKLPLTELSAGLRTQVIRLVDLSMHITDSDSSS
jgi:hypothetical protein